MPVGTTELWISESAKLMRLKSEKLINAQSQLRHLLLKALASPQEQKSLQVFFLHKEIGDCLLKLAIFLTILSGELPKSDHHGADAVWKAMTFDKAMPGNAIYAIDAEACWLFKNDKHDMRVAHAWLKHHTLRDMKDTISTEVRDLLERIRTKIAGVLSPESEREGDELISGLVAATQGTMIQDTVLPNAPKPVIGRRNSKRECPDSKIRTDPSQKARRMTANDGNVENSLGSKANLPPSLDRMQSHDVRSDTLTFRSNTRKKAIDQTHEYGDKTTKPAFKTLGQSLQDTAQSSIRNEASGNKSTQVLDGTLLGSPQSGRLGSQNHTQTSRNRQHMETAKRYPPGNRPLNRPDYRREPRDAGKRRMSQQEERFNEENAELRARAASHPVDGPGFARNQRSPTTPTAPKLMRDRLNGRQDYFH